MPRLSRAGFSLAQVMVVSGMIGGLALLVANLSGALGRTSQQAGLIRAASDISANLRALTNSTAAWNKTVELQKAGALACLADKSDCSSAGGFIKVYGADGKVVFSDEVGAGFTASGVACDTYVPSGNDQCPFRMSVEWQPMCGPVPPCLNPQVKIIGTLAYNPRTQNGPPINVGRFAVNLIQGQGSQSADWEDFCLGMGGEWNADSETCDIQRIACEAAGGQWGADGQGGHKCTILGGENAFACNDNEAMQGIQIVDGLTEPVCVSLTDDFDPDDGTVKLASKNWNNADLKTIPQDKIMGCASGTKGSDSEVAGPCAQDRPPGTAGTCYYRTPLKPNGAPDPSKAGWFQATKNGGVYCKAGIYIPTDFPDP